MCCLSFRKIPLRGRGKTNMRKNGLATCGIMNDGSKRVKWKAFHIRERGIRTVKLYLLLLSDGWRCGHNFKTRNASCRCHSLGVPGDTLGIFLCVRVCHRQSYPFEFWWIFYCSSRGRYGGGGGKGGPREMKCPKIALLETKGIFQEREKLKWRLFFFFISSGID